MICGAFFSASAIKSSRPDRVVVFRQNTAIATYPLHTDVAFTVSGKNGAVDIEIKDGYAIIAHANCPRQICKQAGKINGTLGQLICAPNNIMVQIQSAKSSDGVDALAY
ncbi:MAG: NusG domain II-containing protein [Chitinispirillales bacterium]|nr:NusG domain II-containing protein [Chitinispirillales bacterium]